MAYNTFLILDIETAARPEALAYLPEPTAPANYKDEAKIAAYIDAKRAEQAAQAALDPDTGQITAVAFRLHPDGDPTQALLVGDEHVPDERALLVAVWQEIDKTNGHIAGYNVMGFDLPFILRRSMALGVKPTPILTFSRYQTRPIRDLMAILYNWGNGAKGLKTVAKIYGIPNPLPDLNGSQVATMDRETLRRYVANDVDLTAALYDRMTGYYWVA